MLVDKGLLLHSPVTIRMHRDQVRIKYALSRLQQLDGILIRTKRSDIRPGHKHEMHLEERLGIDDVVDCPQSLLGPVAVGRVL